MRKRLFTITDDTQIYQIFDFISWNFTLFFRDFKESRSKKEGLQMIVLKSEGKNE